MKSMKIEWLSVKNVFTIKSYQEIAPFVNAL